MNRPEFCDCSGLLGDGLEGCRVLTVVVGLEVGRCGVGRVVGDLAVEASVVEPVDVGHGFELDVVDAAPGSLPVDQFPLVETVERLRQRVDAPIDRQVD